MRRILSAKHLCMVVVLEHYAAVIKHSGKKKKNLERVICITLPSGHPSLREIGQEVKQESEETLNKHSLLGHSQAHA